MNGSILAVFNSLTHSRKFHAYAVGIIIAFLVPLVNKYAGLQLDPAVMTSMVLAAVGGAGVYGVSVAIEDGKKAQATASLQAAAIAAPGDTAENMAAAIQGLGGFGSIGSIFSGVGKEIGLPLLIGQLLGRIKGEKNQDKAADIAADVVNQILAQYGQNDRFLKKTGLGR